MDQPNVASIFYGPVLLAAEESAPRSDWRPVTLDAGDIAKSIAGDPATLRFAIDGVPFKPFFETLRALLGVSARDAEVGFSGGSSTREGRAEQGSRASPRPAGCLVTESSSTRSS